MALVDYNSDEDELPTPTPFSTTPAPVVDTPVDDEATTFDSNDVFGINSIPAIPTPSIPSSALPSSNYLPQSAPDVLINDPSVSSSSTTNELIIRPTDSIVFFNPTYASLSLPTQGPQNPWSDRKQDQKQNMLTGHVEQQVFSHQTFTEQQRSFQVLGYANDPSLLIAGSGSSLVGDLTKAKLNGGELLGDVRVAKAEIRRTKRKRKGKGNVGEFEDEEEEGDEEEVVEEGEGGDGVSEAPKKKKEKVQKEYLGPWAGWEDENLGVAVPTVEEWEEQAEKGGAPKSKRSKPVVDAGKQIGFGEEKSVFHGKELKDYLGRSYLHIPTDVDVNLRAEAGTQECFIPKKVVHTWSGHTKGVSKIQLFPKSGHLILSASLDSKIKLWDVYHEGKCLRTFMGHTKAVHDITFDNDGTKFLSASFDRQMKLWDTETGQCLQAFSNGKIPYCVKFHPEKQNIFLAGMSDKKIIQYDMRSGEITQEYDQHLGPVNTINFVDDNRRFITTSDDKTIRVWDFDIPVVIKYIAEPSMHSMPAVGVHPSNKWLAMQSLDNQILIFGSDSFKQNRKKRFAGHTIAGYACEPQFSPDGKFLSSGDGQGNMIFWDWKTCRIVNRIKCHSQVIISHAWLPHETSKVITSSWDGTIKMLD